MDASRLARVVDVLSDRGPEPVLDRFVALCVELLGVSGAGIAVFAHGEHRGAAAVSGGVFAAVDELQFSLGEGPCIDADRFGVPVLESDLEDGASQWPAFSEEALNLDVRAVFAFPMRVGAIRVGVLSLYRETPGELNRADVRDGASLALIALHLVLQLQSDQEPGELPEHLDQVVAHRAQVHQATGMLSVQIGSDLANALSRLRAFAWSRGRTIDDVAAAVVTGSLRFHGDG